MWPTPGLKVKVAKHVCNDLPVLAHMHVTFGVRIRGSALLCSAAARTCSKSTQTFLTSWNKLGNCSNCCDCLLAFQDVSRCFKMFQDVSRLRQQTVSACFCLTLINSSCSWLTFWPRSAFSTYPRIRVKFSQGFESNYITPRFVWTRTRVSCGQSDSAGTPECMISEKDVDLSSVFFFRASTIHHSLQFSSWRFFPTRSNYFSQRVLAAVDSCSSIASSSIARWPLLTRCHVWPWIQRPKTSDCGICSFKTVQSNSSQLLVAYKLLLY